MEELQKGEIFKNPFLASTLKEIGKKGRKSFLQWNHCKIYS